MASFRQATNLGAFVAILLIAIASVECEKSVSTNFCQGCRSAVSFLHRLNRTSNRGPFKNVMRDFCEDAYPPSTDYRQGPCDYYVAKTFWLLDRINPETHCDEIAACGPSSLYDEGPVIGVESNKDNIVCNICVDTVNQFKESLTDPNNIKQIRNGFQKLCKYLGKIHEEKNCDDLLNNYLDQMLEFVEHIDSKTYCAALSLCDKPQLRQVSTFKRIFASLEDFTSFGPQLGVKLIKESNSLDRVEPTKRQQVQPPTAVDEFPGGCTLCKTVIKQVSDLVKDNRTEASIEWALEQACSLLYPLSEDGEKECDAMVEKYTKDIVEILIDETAPELVCMMIGLCTYNTNPTVRPTASYSLPLSKQQVNTRFNDLFEILDRALNTTSEICLECKMFVHFVKNKMSDVKSIEEFKQIMKTKICQRISDKSISATCSNWVDEFSQTFFYAIVHNLNPEEVCEELQACQPKQELISHDKSVTMNQDNYCDTCTSTVSYIDKLLATQSIDKEISHLVDTVCNKFSANSREECRLIIDTFGPEILRAIAVMNNPRQLCCDIGLCHKDPNKKMQLGASKCTFGPSYWCLSKEHATACRAHDYCRQKVWKAIN